MAGGQHTGRIVAVARVAPRRSISSCCSQLGLSERVEVLQRCYRFATTAVGWPLAPCLRTVAGTGVRARKPITKGMAMKSKRRRLLRPHVARAGRIDSLPISPGYMHALACR